MDNSVKVTVVAEGVSGLSKRPGRKASDERIQVIKERFGSVEAYDIHVAGLDLGPKLVLKMEIDKATQAIKNSKKNGGRAALVGRAPSEVRRSAAKLLFGMDYETWRHDLAASKDEARKANETAVVDALTILLSRGQKLTAAQAQTFMGESEHESSLEVSETSADSDHVAE